MADALHISAGILSILARSMENTQKLVAILTGEDDNQATKFATRIRAVYHKSRVYNAVLDNATKLVLASPGLGPESASDCLALCNEDVSALENILKKSVKRLDQVEHKKSAMARLKFSIWISAEQVDDLERCFDNFSKSVMLLKSIVEGHVSDSNFPPSCLANLQAVP